MHTLAYNGINECLVKMASLLLKEGKKRITRGKICYELPEPIMIKICNPSARIVTIRERKWNKYLPFAESLWLAGGYNDLEMIKNYLPRMRDFSDDGKFLRGGYGPRIRHWNNNQKDYEIKFPFKKQSNQVSVDQFRFVVECFKRDVETRQAVITIEDPLKDCFEKEQLKSTKDFPCTRSLHFIKNVEGKLDLYVLMRSNDFLWGATGVNIFNYTFMLEYFSAILGIELGSYFHIVNNMHYYAEFRERLEQLQHVDYEDISYVYNKTFNSYDSFIDKVHKLGAWEKDLREGRTIEKINLNDDFFNDWAAVLYKHNTKANVKFINPSLNKIFLGRN